MAYHRTKYLDVFNINLHMGIYKTHKSLCDAYKALCYKHNLVLTEAGQTRAFVWQPQLAEPEIYILFVSSEIDYPLIGHEVWHLTKLILKYHGIDSRKDSEVFALLHEYLLHNVTKFIKDKKIPL